MRRYFLNDGQVADVEMQPPGLSDKGAIATGRLLSSQREEPLDGFQVWHRNRMVFRLHAPAEAVVSIRRWTRRQRPYDLPVR